ncbi:MAG: porin [Bacteroidales bacterium]|nr:porin [Bacteroidales bacterium]
MFKNIFLVLLLVFLGFSQLNAQTEVDERAMINFRKGLGFNAPDSSFGINLRVRMQNRVALNLNENLGINDIEARVSRLRLRFDGYILDQKITYYIQLSFSRGDQDWDNTYMANVVRDAMVYYRFNPNFYVGFGQGKLPGNRQRIISSGQQQFFDRSNVNANYTLDRDFGLFGYYSNNVGPLFYNLKAAVSTGDGRNQIRTNNGLMYTGRVELLPLGKFTNDSDFSEGDLEHESTPKLSLATGYATNQKAMRTRGTTGSSLFESRNMNSFFADVLLKYQGWAFSSEYINRTTDASAITYNPVDSLKISAVNIGEGINTQLSYYFKKSHWEIAARYSVVVPGEEIRSYNMKDTYYLLGINKYVKKHLTKFQLFTGFRSQQSYTSHTFGSDQFLLVFQVELGI